MPETALATLNDQPEHGIPDLNHEADADYGPIARNPARIKAILALLDAGHTQTAIAKLFGITQPTVSKLAREWTPVAELAERRAKSLAVEAVESLNRSCKAAEEQGKHGPQVAILTAAGLMRTENNGPAVQVFIAGAMQDVRLVYQQPTELPLTPQPTQSLSNTSEG